MSDTKIEDILNLKTDVSHRISLLNAYAVEIRNSKPAISFESANTALKLSEETHNEKGKADSLTNIGFYRMHMGDHENAFMVIMEAVSIYNELEDWQGLANAQYILGVVYLRTGNFDPAIEFLHKSLAYREKINDRSGMAACFFQLSYINRHFNDDEAAKTNIEKCLALRKELNDTLGIGAALMVLGELYITKKDFTKAKEILQTSLEMRKNAGEEMGYFASLLRWAELHKELGEYEVAMEACNNGYKMAESANIGFGMMRFLQMFGNIEMKRNNIAAAKQHLEKALEFAQKHNYRSIQYEVHQSISNICKQEGDFKSAFEHFEKFHSIKEEVISMQSNTQLKSVQLVAQIEFARKEADIEKEKNKIISEKNKEITDSINYARRIQTGILPSENDLKNCLHNFFVLYKPKDIVSGDFYWCKQVTDPNTKHKWSLVAAIDCTGHGVPGAFMSMLGHTLLNQTVYDPSINTTGGVLNFLNEELPKNLKSHQLQTSIRDGMDMALCAIDFENLKLHFAGANNPLWVIRGNECIEIKPDKQAISASDDMVKKPFTTHKMDLKKNDTVFLFTDGYADQFGGPKGKKFYYSRLKEVLLSNSNHSMNELKEILSQTFTEWKGNLEQIDDVCVIGIRI